MPDPGSTYAINPNTKAEPQHEFHWLQIDAIGPWFGSVRTFGNVVLEENDWRDHYVTLDRLLRDAN